MSSFGVETLMQLEMILLHHSDVDYSPINVCTIAENAIIKHGLTIIHTNTWTHDLSYFFFLRIWSFFHASKRWVSLPDSFICKASWCALCNTMLHDIQVHLQITQRGRWPLNKPYLCSRKLRLPALLITTYYYLFKELKEVELKELRQINPHMCTFMFRLP